MHVTKSSHLNYRNWLVEVDDIMFIGQRKGCAPLKENVVHDSDLHTLLAPIENTVPVVLPV
eukprot:4318695-Prorocentrum_lima.AAC.1